MKYKFHVGDYVETKDGAVGYVCQVARDIMRWICTLGSPKWPVRGMYFIESSEDFDVDYKQIGQYNFIKPEQPKEIEKLNPGWRGDEAYRKINELVDVVNELRKANSNAE